jgi:hypothetical protein
MPGCRSATVGTRGIRQISSVSRRCFRGAASERSASLPGSSCNARRPLLIREWGSCNAGKDAIRPRREPAARARRRAGRPGFAPRRCPLPIDGCSGRLASPPAPHLGGCRGSASPPYQSPIGLEALSVGSLSVGWGQKRIPSDTLDIGSSCRPALCRHAADGLVGRRR